MTVTDNYFKSIIHGVNIPTLMIAMCIFEDWGGGGEIGSNLTKVMRNGLKRIKSN